MRIHIRTSRPKSARRDGDKKTIKGVMHERISTRVLVCGWDAKSDEVVHYLACDRTGGKQRHEWVPVTELVGNSPYKRRYYSEIDGPRNEIPC